jgi:hypothetical protein
MSNTNDENQSVSGVSKRSLQLSTKLDANKSKASLKLLLKNIDTGKL